NQALAMSVAFTAATSSVLHDTMNNHLNARAAGKATAIQNIFQSLLIGPDGSSSSIARAQTFEEVAEPYRKTHPEKARQLYRYAIDLRERTTGGGDPQLVADLRASSELAEAAGDIKEANELMEHAVELCKSQAWSER